MNGRRGYIDRSGKMEIELTPSDHWLALGNFSGGFACVEGPKPGWFGYIDTKGKYIWGPREYKQQE